MFGSTRTFVRSFVCYLQIKKAVGIQKNSDLIEFNLVFSIINIVEKLLVLPKSIHT